MTQRITRRQKSIRNAVERINAAVPRPLQSDETLHTIELTGSQVFAILPLLEEFLAEPVDATLVVLDDTSDSAVPA